MRYMIAASIICAFLSPSTADAKGRHHHRHHHHYRHHDGAARHFAGHRRHHHHGSGNLVASSGATAAVSGVALSHFQCLLTALEGEGYHIDFMGGFASRGSASAHPTGNALDINQTDRNVVTRQLPANATALAHSCGLEHGAVWHGRRGPDKGHFEMAHGYGYIGGRHYASSRHRRYASLYRHRHAYLYVRHHHHRRYARV